MISLHVEIVDDSAIQKKMRPSSTEKNIANQKGKVNDREQYFAVQLDRLQTQFSRQLDGRDLYFDSDNTSLESSRTGNHSRYQHVSTAEVMEEYSGIR